MEEQKDRGFKQEPIAAARHGTLVDVCNWVQLAFRFVAVFGEPAKWVVKEIANAWDLYSTSPQDEAHRAFREKVEELGQMWERRTKRLIWDEEASFGRLLGVGPTIIETPRPPPSGLLEELYFEKAEITRRLADLERRYSTRLNQIEDEYTRCLRRARHLSDRVLCNSTRTAQIEEARREYNEEKQLLLTQLQEINREIARLYR